MDNLRSMQLTFFTVNPSYNIEKLVYILEKVFFLLLLRK